MRVGQDGGTALPNVRAMGWKMTTQPTTPTATDLARETIAEASWEHYEHGEYPAYSDLDKLAPERKQWELARADAILAALTARGLTIANEGQVTVHPRALCIWDGDAGDHQLYVEGKSVGWTDLKFVNVIQGPFETRFIYLCQSDDEVTTLLYTGGLLWSETINGSDFTDYDGGWTDGTSPQRWDTLWSRLGNNAALAAKGLTISGPGQVAVHPIKLSSIEHIYTNWAPTMGPTSRDRDIERELEDAMTTDVIRQNAALSGSTTGPGQIAVSRKDAEFIVSHMWVSKREAHDHAGLVQDRLRAALSGTDDQPADVHTEDAG